MRGSQPEPAALLRVSEVAAIISISERWIWERIASGEIPVVRVGKLVRIRRADVDAFARTGQWPEQATEKGKGKS